MFGFFASDNTLTQIFLTVKFIKLLKVQSKTE